MYISSSFYIQSWLKNSLMAMGTGFVVGVIVPIIPSLLTAIIALIIYQFVSADRFFGTRRGEFEYEYRNDILERRVRKLILKTFGIVPYIIYVQDGFNAISDTQASMCRKLLQNESIRSSPERSFSVYIRLSHLAMKRDNLKRGKEMVLRAVELRPNDLVANYILAVCYEMEGLADDATKHYNAAANDPYLNTDQLRNFILSQVQRIKLKGPMNRPPALGVKYMSW